MLNGGSRNFDIISKFINHCHNIIKSKMEDVDLTVIDSIYYIQDGYFNHGFIENINFEETVIQYLDSRHSIFIKNSILKNCIIKGGTFENCEFINCKMAKEGYDLKFKSVTFKNCNTKFDTSFYRDIKFEKIDELVV
jgi:uncharacterized protein YjbI with pentapeptide repeats